MSDYNKLKSYFDSNHNITDGEILAAFIKSLETQLQIFSDKCGKYGIDAHNIIRNIEMEISILNACAKAVESLNADNVCVRERRMARSNLLIDIADIEVIK